MESLPEQSTCARARLFTRRCAIAVPLLQACRTLRKPTKVVVGFSQMENNNPWRIAETNSMRQEGARRHANFDIVVTDAQGQTAKQVSDVEDLVARRVSTIFLAPREFEGLTPALDSARELNIPVFLIDREAAGTPGKDYVCFIGSDFVQQARRVADWLISHTGGRASIVELTGTPGSSVAGDRSRGFTEQIASHPAMRIIASQTADFSRAAAQNVMQNILQAKRNEITSIYAHNDEMAIGAIQALKAAGLRPGKDITVVSIDGEKAALQLIVAGELAATAESNPRFGPLAFRTLDRFRAGEKMPPKIVLEDRFFDATNAREFIDEAY